jgi:cellulose synthase/poly-beta-1,6-N-acetylglucosamine synthase-like glycosyltransferase/peptidoglycan/xylan/chitin deacetylase (PgdA/CDA1 family)/spore germination protein YaaH
MSSSAAPGGKFVFLDAAGRRWPRLRRWLFALGCAGLFAVVLFIASVWVQPAVRFSPGVRELRGQLKAAAGSLGVQQADPKANSWQRYPAQSRAGQERLAKLRAASGKTPREPREVRLGFYVDWDANALASLREHAADLTHVTPEWFSISGPEATLNVEPDAPLAEFCAARGLNVIPILRNLAGDIWQPEAVENLARGPAQDRARFIAGLVGQISSLKVGGVLLEWSELDPALREDYTQLLAELSRALHEADKELWLTVSMDDQSQAFDLGAVSGSVDRFVATMSGEHSESDEPGPLASQTWFEGWLGVIKEYGDPGQWVVALGAYGTDWDTTRHTAETISFRDAMSRASYSGAEGAGGVPVTAPHWSGRYAYSDPGGEHVVSFLDAIAFHNQLLAARAAGFSGVGVQRLGTEDPQIWDVLKRSQKVDAAFAQTISHLHADQTVTHVGRGEVVSVDTSHDDGERNVILGDDGRLSAHYTDFPTYPVLYHQGAGDKHFVTLTFDDGPNPKWTPQVLDILKARGVPAAFFILGRNAEDYPDLVRRILAEGHEIGNHTYTHANLAEMSAWRMRLELDATERLIESITGISTTLFRPPYNADATPTSIAELAPLRYAEELGYLVVLEKIDPQDWARPGAETILQRVKDQRNEGNIILLHDAGGDRSQTVAALPQIIDWLTERGDRIVSLSELLHIPRGDLMPPVQASAQPSMRAIAGTGFRLWHWLVEFLWAFMIFTTALVVVRSLLIAWLAWRQQREEARTPPPAPAEPLPVSVLIAAFNEGKVIANTLRSVLASEYPGPMEVIVVDDGSGDDTAAVVGSVAESDGRVRLVRQANAGKSAALSRALSCALHEIVVFLDADTHFEKQTIAQLVQSLAADPRVASVSGNARVGNAHNFVTRCQQLEYICGFNLDRRAYTRWDCVTVVPGAVSALRRSAIEAAGGFSHDTLAEDTDMTLMLHRLGYSARYASRAVAWTEAPEHWGALAKQRFRWAFGTMQCLWKHRDMVFNPRYRALAFFSLPSIWFFQVFLVAITPLAEAVLLYAIASGYGAQIWRYFLVFLSTDFFLAALACWLEREPLLRALLIVPMRLVYRWLLAWVIWRAIFRALKGALVGWGKLDRTATVPARL